MGQSDVHGERVADGLAANVLDALVCALGVVLTFALFALLRLSQLVLAPGVVLLDRSGAARLVRAAPRAALAAASVVAFFGCSAESGPRLFDCPVSWPSLIGAYLLSLSIFYVSAEALLSRPPTFAGLRAEIERSWPERWYARKLAQPLDAFFVRMILRNTAIVAPAFFATVLPSTCSVFSALGYLLAISLASAAHETLDHGNLHNHFFRVTHVRERFDRWILRCTDAYLTFVLNPICGRIPHWYRITHLIIHHVENNGPDDFQTTLFWDRASFLDFCRHGARIAFTKVVGADAIAYLVRHKRFRPAHELARTMLLTHLTLALLAAYNWPGAAVLLGLRLLGGPIGAITAFSWHGFVDMDEPDNQFRSNVNLKTAIDGHGSFGDNVHIEHHLHPQRHWSHYAADAQANAARYSEEQAITLDLGTTSLPSALWRRRFDELAACVVDGGDRTRVARMLEARTRPLVERRQTRPGRALDAALGRLAARLWL